ncbi:hypothetical protein [Olleya sp. HaHaR_3_96]|uniref:hypothetical protein n=1 Tax=Olleya sp. HaHaR_3_96 TaxID=2745560 RepID=UPI001C4E748A|nr:hypothetical protein [Olleya sp. HaHaR_3_96]QXP58564.1 hypothetical protein H0I26_11610 [Olleya sp. HaHaR_3_96]
MNPFVFLGIFGSIASIISLIISWKIEKPKWIHTIYTFVLTILIGVSFLYFQSINDENRNLSKELKVRNSIEHNASRILSTYSNINDVGHNRGFILTSFAFLEKYQNEFPETYIIAKKLVVDGLKITENNYGKGVFQESDEENRLKDGAKTMYAMLEGLMKSNNE